jgi:hypothetical protein
VSSFPAADQLEKLRTRLQTLVSVGDPKQVDRQLEQLLLSLGLDPTSPTAWRDGFLLLACLHYDVGEPPRSSWVRPAMKFLGGCVHGGPSRKIEAIADLKLKSP